MMHECNAVACNSLSYATASIFSFKVHWKLFRILPISPEIKKAASSLKFWSFFYEFFAVLRLFYFSSANLRNSDLALEGDGSGGG